MPQTKLDSRFPKLVCFCIAVLIILSNSKRCEQRKHMDECHVAVHRSIQHNTLNEPSLTRHIKHHLVGISHCSEPSLPTTPSQLLLCTQNLTAPPRSDHQVRNFRGNLAAGGVGETRPGCRKCRRGGPRPAATAARAPLIGWARRAGPPQSPGGAARASARRSGAARPRRRRRGG